MTIQIFDDLDNEIKYKRWVFPGGEIGVKIDENRIIKNNEHLIFQVRNQIVNSEDFMVVLNLISILNDHGTSNIDLYMPYLPYGRQDRICNKGESFALEVFLNILNTVKFNKLITLDVHNPYITIKLCGDKNFFYEDYSVANFVKKLIKYDYIDNNTTIVLPDKGASKKLDSVEYYFKGKILIADKIRDSFNKVTHIMKENPSGNVLVLDDICDGGATFLSLASCLTNAEHVILAVTHGIFSKGLVELLDYYDEIVCWNNMSNIVSGVGHYANFHQIGN